MSRLSTIAPLLLAAQAIRDARAQQGDVLGAIAAFKGDRGDTGLPGRDGVDGKDAVGIASAVVRDGRLLVTTTDGVETDVGAVIGPRGERGPLGESIVGPPGAPGRDAVGLPGRDGVDGASGRDGVGVATARMVDGDLVVVLTTGEEVRVGRVRGADGRDGPRGPAGPIGRGIPEGGTSGQVLAKASDGDYDTEWVDSGGGPGGGVTSVNGQSGVVVLDADDVGAAAPATVPKTATATVDFGATHGGTLASVAVAATWVTGSSVIVVTPGGASADHDAEDALIEEIKFAVTAVNNGVEFTVTASAPHGTWGRYTINAVGL